MNLKAEYDILQSQVTAAKASGQPIEKFIKRQIEIVEQVKDEFIMQSENKGIKLENSIHRSSVEISYNAQLISLCEKIGISSEKYEKQIAFIQKLFGLEE